MEKHVIFIGDDGHYNRIAKPLKDIESITFDEAKAKIKADFGEIAYFYQKQNDALPLEIICDEEGMLNGKPSVLHNGYQYVHGDVLVGKYNDQSEKWEGLNSYEVKELCSYLENNIYNDIQLSPLKHLIKDQEKVTAKTQESEKELER